MPSIGIDLGTTNSAAASFRNGVPLMLRDLHGEEVVPSIVAIDKETRAMIVGERARSILNERPEFAVEEVKRKMGTTHKYNLGAEEYSAHEISSLILRHLKVSADDYLGTPVDSAVITVPANFPDPARLATMAAGELAGFRVERIINEPTAAALAYGHSEGMEEEVVMVYDLGGGTFDVSIVEYMGSAVDVLASAGDRHLGGKDFDRLILERIVRPALLRDHGVDLEVGTSAYFTLLHACEQAKKVLSFSAQTSISVPVLNTPRKFIQNLRIGFTRTQFEGLIGPMIDATEVSIRRALKDAGMQNRRVNRVLLVGGSTRIPYVRQLVQRLTGINPSMDIDPDRAVALGAAVQAAILSGETDNIIMDTCPLSLGTDAIIDVGGIKMFGSYAEIVRPNTKHLKACTDTFYTFHPEQEEVDFRVYQRDIGSLSQWAEIDGEPNTAEGFTLLGRRTIKLPAIGEGQAIKATYIYNPNGIVDVAVQIGSHSENFQISSFLENTNVAVSRERMETLWEESALAGKVRATIRAAERALERNLREPDRVELAALVNALKEAVASGKDSDVQRLEPLLTDLLFDLEE